MASIIRVKRSTTPGSVPGSLQAGELAINLTDRKLFSSNGSAVFEIGESALANTNAYIATRASWAALTGTNTALRTLISDRLQVANAAATYETKATADARLANTNSYIATRASWTALTGTNTALRTLISDRLQVANAAATYETKATADARLANTNSYIATRASWSALTSTNTALRTLISDRLQVANAAALYATKGYAASNTYVNNTFLKKTGSQASSQSVNTNVAFSANVSIQGKLVVTGGITAYFANNVSTGDNMIYLNANSTVSNPDLGFAGNYNDGTYAHAGFFRDASDNGTFKVFDSYTLEPDANVYINTAHASFRLAPFAALNIRVANNIIVAGNTSVRGLLANGSLGTSGYVLKTNGTNAYWDAIQPQTQYLQVTNANAKFATKAYAAANSYVNTLLANTNSYIASRASWTALTGTNTALRTLISDRLQVANAAATYQTIATERAALANTNAYIATKVNTTTFNSALANTNSYIATRASWTALTGTNTALRTLISDRLQVANAASLYATKINPTTSGILAHTGRATISTNLAVSGNTSISGNLLVDGDLTVEGSVTYISSSTLNVDDSMIKLAANNAADTVDVGLYGKYVATGTKYSGLFRDASDGVWKFYTGSQSEPTTTVDTGAAGYTVGTIEAIIDGGTY